MKSCYYRVNTTRGVITSEKYSRQEAQISLLCVQRPLNLYLELHEPEENITCERWLSSTAVETRTNQFYVCTYVYSKKNFMNKDSTVIDDD